METTVKGPEWRCDDGLALAVPGVPQQAACVVLRRCNHDAHEYVQLCNRGPHRATGDSVTCRAYCHEITNIAYLAVCDSTSRPIHLSERDTVLVLCSIPVPATCHSGHGPSTRRVMRR
jgi:hypothetical protein